MGLLEMYFWMIIIISGILNFPILIFSEDLKDEKRFKKYLKISFFIGLIGVLMILIEWNYRCGYTCLVFTFSPFITLLACKTVMIISKLIFKREGFQVDRKGLVDGIYQKNKGDLKFQTYYTLYTGFLTAIPVIIFIELLHGIENLTC
jgi:hypothetical protein